MRRLRIVPSAQRDIDRLLDFSEARFGARAADKYRRLLETALEHLRADPDRAGVRVPTSRRTWLRTYHLSSSRRSLPRPERVTRPRHLIVFRADEERISVFRVLDDRMDLRSRLRHIPDGW